MKFLIAVPIISIISLIISLLPKIKKFVEKNTDNERIRKKIKNIQIVQVSTMNKYGEVENDYSIFQDPIEFRIHNTGRDLCSDERLESISVIDYCCNIEL